MRFGLPTLYLTLSLSYILLSLGSDFPLQPAVKILPLLVLFAYVLKQAPSHWRLVCALLFSMTGDVLLAQSDHYFLFGLAAFFTAHIFYLLCLLPLEKNTASHKSNVLILTGYLGYAFGILSLVWAGLGTLTLPVLGYLLVLLTMSVATWHSQGRNSWLIAGGLLFVLSDSLLGLNQFHHSIPQAHTLIMLTYYSAQFALVRGFMQKIPRFHKKSEDPT